MATNPNNEIPQWVLNIISNTHEYTNVSDDTSSINNELKECLVSSFTKESGGATSVIFFFAGEGDFFNYNALFQSGPEGVETDVYCFDPKTYGFNKEPGFESDHKLNFHTESSYEKESKLIKAAMNRVVSIEPNFKKYSKFHFVSLGKGAILMLKVIELILKDENPIINPTKIVMFDPIVSFTKSKMRKSSYNFRWWLSFVYDKKDDIDTFFGRQKDAYSKLAGRYPLTDKIEAQGITSASQSVNFLSYYDLHGIFDKISIGKDIPIVTVNIGSRGGLYQTDDHLLIKEKFGKGNDGKGEGKEVIHYDNKSIDTENNVSPLLYDINGELNSIKLALIRKIFN